MVIDNYNNQTTANTNKLNIQDIHMCLLK